MHSLKCWPWLLWTAGGLTGPWLIRASTIRPLGRSAVSLLFTGRMIRPRVDFHAYLVPRFSLQSLFNLSLPQQLHEEISWALVPLAEGPISVRIPLAAPSEGGASPFARPRAAQTRCAPCSSCPPSQIALVVTAKFASMSASGTFCHGLSWWIHYP